MNLQTCPKLWAMCEFPCLVTSVSGNDGSMESSTNSAKHPSDVHDSVGSSSIEAFTTDHIAAAFESAPLADLGNQLRDIDGVADVDVLVGADGRAALAPDSRFDKLKAKLSEERRPRERLDDTLAEGGAVVVVSHDGTDESVSAVTGALQDHAAGWIFSFGDLTWSELSSPQSS